MKRAILVAENHEGVLLGFRDWLTRHGYAVLTAREGTEAIAIARDQRPRLAILDYSMRGTTSGLFAAHAIREAPETRHIPIIMMATRTMSLTEEAALNGFNAFFSKPFDKDGLDGLLAKIRELLKPRVLVIDDNEQYRLLIARIIQPMCAVITASDSKEGMERAVLEDPDLVIVDRSMPVRGGEEVARDIISYCNIPVIMVTGDVLNDSEQETIRAVGVRAVIGKPFTLNELATTVAALLPQLSPPA